MPKNGIESRKNKAFGTEIATCIFVVTNKYQFKIKNFLWPIFNFFLLNIHYWLRYFIIENTIFPRKIHICTLRKQNVLVAPFYISFNWFFVRTLLGLSISIIKGVPKGGSIYPQALKFCPKLKKLSPSPYFFENLSLSLMLVKK